MSLPIVATLVYLAIISSIHSRNAVFLLVVLLPLAFVVYRVAQADMIARAIVTILASVAIYIVYYYGWLLIADIPGDPESIAHIAATQLAVPSRVLPLLIPAIGYLVGAMLLYAPSLRVWFGLKGEHDA